MTDDIIQYTEPTVERVASSSPLIEWAEGARAAHGIAQSLAQTPFVPQSMQGKPGLVTAAILAGSELGLQPISALRSIDVISGTPAMRAHAMRGLVQSRGHEVWIEESTNTRCIARGRRKGSERVQEATWDIDRAKGLNLTGKDNWRKQPKAMLIARATSELCRMIASDVLLGLPYSAEELGDGEADEQPTEAPKKRTIKRKPVERPDVAEPDLDAPEAPADEEIPDDSTSTTSLTSVLTLPLSHFTNSVVEPYSITQDNEESHVKPRGLWVSIDGDDDWPSWCESESYDIGGSQFRVTLAPNAHILHLATPEQIVEFDREYGIENRGGRWRVDWERVSDRYQGIIIAPYQWSLRLRGPSWYYTWDCASGCIWDAAAIESVKAVES